MSNALATHFAETGVKWHLTAPYSPQQNGFVKCRNQMVVGMARCMLKENGMPSYFWAEAVTTAVYMLNRAHTRSIDEKIPTRHCSKAYMVYDSSTWHMHVSRDIVFDEGASWDWSKDGGDNTGAGDDFVVDYIISEPAGSVSTPAARSAAAEKRGEIPSRQDIPCRPDSLAPQHHQAVPDNNSRHSLRLTRGACSL
ncbi:hypothetical protein QYE76_068113 [Lolium multiflorum]|uniref:Integrase catalytic domain-containing protein n=1 Tax=Lolium multiflorum TaxID=4521 RepID=A0AAD8SFM1_LOLMU|nr:hypothetical protein QYE76_068113 [Lolium multiflorum]